MQCSSLHVAFHVQTYQGGKKNRKEKEIRFSSTMLCKLMESFRSQDIDAAFLSFFLPGESSEMQAIIHTGEDNREGGAVCKAGAFDKKNKPAPLEILVF